MQGGGLSHSSNNLNIINSLTHQEPLEALFRASFNFLQKWVFQKHRRCPSVVRIFFQTTRCKVYELLTPFFRRLRSR